MSHTEVAEPSSPMPERSPTPERTDHHAMRGYANEKADVLRRLARVSGQVRGITRMVEEDEYCIDVLTQISAATKALQSVALKLLDDHMGHCVVSATGAEQEAKLAEASAAIARLVRS